MRLSKIAARKLVEKYVDEYPVNLYRIAKKINAEIYFTAELPDSILGSTRITNVMNTKIILVNMKQRTSRQRFTIAHEIGHIILHHSGSEYQLSDTNHLQNNKKPWRERQADIFAAELLMPTKEVKDLYYNRHITDISEISEYFGVSLQAIQIRVKELNII